MKKQIKKLNLNKRTISNLTTVEMNQKVGGVKRTYSCTYTTTNTQHGHTCNNNC